MHLSMRSLVVVVVAASKISCENKHYMCLPAVPLALAERMFGVELARIHHVET